MSDIAGWLEEIGLGKYAEAFRSNDIDFDVLPALGQDELKELGVSLGDRRRLLKAIAARSGTTAETPAPSAPPMEMSAAPAPAPSAPGPEPSAERRQLTVLFADLVGSTALSQAIDAEDLRDVLHGYHDAVTSAIRDSGGFIAKFMGDGVLVYFGYPQASENACRVRVDRAAMAPISPKLGRLIQPMRISATRGYVVGGSKAANALPSSDIPILLAAVID